MSDRFDAGYTAYQSQRGWFRRQIRRAYLASAAGKLRGPTLDFGCGVGDLLARLPDGSMGVEYNEASVAFCKERGLDVIHYDGFADDWALSFLPKKRTFESMVISHVLEHLDEPVRVLGRLLAAARGLGVERVLVIVPGRAGYRIDATHVTFVDQQMLALPELTVDTGFQLTHTVYYPGDWRSLGEVFAHHELQVTYSRSA